MKRIKNFINVKILPYLRSGYGYYYYLCFKNFIIKLIIPEKIIAIKWRITIDEEFKYVTYVEKCLITRYIGRIRNNILFDNKDTFHFKFNNIPTAPSSIYEKDVINPEIKPQNDFYFVEKNCLIEYIVDEFNDNSIVFHSENFTHFKIGNSEWIPIENIDYRYGGLCLFSFEHKLFAIIETDLISEVSKNEIGNLIEKDLKELTLSFQKIKQKI